MTSHAHRPAPLSDVEFLSLFKIGELPECGTGLWLLKQWVESDPDVPAILQEMDGLQIDVLRREGNPIFQKFLDHSSDCIDCQRTLNS